MKIEAYQSEYTGEIFKTKSAYYTHVKKYKQKELEKEEELKRQKLVDDIRHIPRKISQTIEEFEKKAFDAITILNGDNPDKLLLLKFNDLHFGDVSNSHSCPIGGKTNWSGRDKDLPTSYKGWNGDITIVYSQTKNTDLDRDRVENLVEHFPGINTGSGGYRGDVYNDVKGYVLQYNLKLYLDDFPVIKQQYEEYEKLLKEKNNWENTIDDLYVEEIIRSEEIKQYEDVLTVYGEKLKEIHEVINTNVLLLEDEKSKIRSSILSANPFYKNDEFEKLSKTFQQWRW